MTRKQIAIVGFLLLFGAHLSVAAQTSNGHTFQDLLPNHVGNNWTYVGSGFAVDGQQRGIAAVRRSGGWVYFEGIPGSGDRWIWESSISARAWVWNPNRRTFAFWLDLGVGQGGSFTVDQDAGIGCWDGATYMISNEDFTADTPVGTFNQALEITLVNQNCADAGVTRVVFAPNFGIVEYETQSIGGPRRWVIQHAVVNGREYSSDPFRGRLRSSATLNKAVYKVGPTGDGTIEPDTMSVQLEIVNGTDSAIDYTYFSGQTFDIFITDSEGTEVYRWSFGRGFILPVIQKQLLPGESIRVGDEFELRNNEGDVLPPGDYKVEIIHVGQGLDASVITPFKIED